MKKQNHNGDKAMTWMFAGFLGVMCLAGLVIPQKSFSETENRYLQTRPRFTVAALLDGSFGKKYEKYLSDQFPGREGWVGVKVTAERLSFKGDVNGVYFGKDGYLIEKFDAEDVEGDQLERNLDKLAAFSVNAAEALGWDRVRVMLVPSASQIMTDHLPVLAAPFDQEEVAARFTEKVRALTAQQEAEKAGTEKAGVEKAGTDHDAAARCPLPLLVPVAAALKSHSGEPLYYRTDHHWTARGAFRGYEAWAESMGLEPWSEAAFEIRTAAADFHGTVHSKLNIPWEYDSIETWLPKEYADYRVSFDEETQEYPSLYFDEALKGKDKYAVYLDGNHAVTKIENRSVNRERKEKKLLIIKDSYAHSFVPYAANHYGTVYMADLRYLNINLKDWMAEQGITDVLVLYQIPGFAKEKTVSKLVYK